MAFLLYYNSTDTEKKQEEIARMFDKFLTMCVNCGNGRGKLDKTNFPHISFFYSGFCFAIGTCGLNVKTYTL